MRLDQCTRRKLKCCKNFTSLATSRIVIPANHNLVTVLIKGGLKFSVLRCGCNKHQIENHQTSPCTDKFIQDMSVDRPRERPTALHRTESRRGFNFFRRSRAQFDRGIVNREVNQLWHARSGYPIERSGIAKPVFRRPQQIKIRYQCRKIQNAHDECAHRTNQSRSVLAITGVPQHGGNLAWIVADEQAGNAGHTCRRLAQGSATQHPL